MGFLNILTSVGAAVFDHFAGELERTARTAGYSAPRTANNLAKIEEMQATARQARQKAKDWSSKTCTECGEQQGKANFSSEYADMKIGVCQYCEVHKSEPQSKLTRKRTPKDASKTALKLGPGIKLTPKATSQPARKAAPKLTPKSK